MDVIGQMPREDFEEMIQAIVETAIERKLIEILGDPDEGLMIREDIHDRLLRQQRAVAAGERGLPFDDVVQKLGLG